jgi:hypothetical protein
MVRVIDATIVAVIGFGFWLFTTELWPTFNSNGWLANF